MANHALNHLWLIGPMDRVERWTDDDHWAALSPIPWHGLFHPEHGYPIGVAASFWTNRNPVSVFDQERRPGIEHDVDQFLSFMDEGWGYDGHEWRTARHGNQRRVEMIPGSSHHTPMDVSQKMWVPLALSIAEQQPIPVTATDLSLVTRRALWRNDAQGVRAMLEQPESRPRHEKAWWDGVEHACLRAASLNSDQRPWGIRYERGEPGTALHAWLTAMPMEHRSLPRLLELFEHFSVDPAVRLGAQAWVPEQDLWDVVGLSLPPPTLHIDHDPRLEDAITTLWHRAAPSTQERLAAAWLPLLRRIAHHNEEDEAFRRTLRLLNAWLPHHDALRSPFLQHSNDWQERGWTRLATWAEQAIAQARRVERQTLHSALPETSATDLPMFGRPRARL